MNSTQPWTKWIDTDIVHSLYADGIEEFGGLRSTANDGCIDAALGAAYSAELYSMPEVDEETIVSGITFCGYLLFYISTKHCWSDGNKRAAWKSAMWVLSTMGLTIDAPNSEVIAYCLDIADHKIDKGEDVVNWLADRLREL